MIGIYRITNKINNHTYIGSSIDIKRRWRTHIRKLNGNHHENKHLQHSWDKYGKDAFKFKVILLCEEFELLRYEQWFLDNVVKWKVDYNISKCAEAPALGLVGEDAAFYGKNHTEETKIKISIAKKENYSISENHPWFNRQHTEETKRKIGKANSKLVEKQVLEIRKLYSTGKYTQKELGDCYGVGITQISRIVRKVCWKHL